MANTNWRSNLNGIIPGSAAIAACGTNNISSTTLQLSTAYTYNSAGNAFFWQFQTLESANFTDFYVYCGTVTGTGSTTLLWEIREGLNGTSKPGSTLTASGTFSITATGWNLVTGLSVALTAGKMYCLVIGDPSGNVTNNVTLTIGGGGGSGIGPSAFQIVVVQTTGGFASGNTSLQTSRQAFGCFKIGSYWQGGVSFDTVATVTTGTYERGCVFQVPVAMTLIGAAELFGEIYRQSGFILNLYEYGTATNGTALVSHTIPTITTGGGSAPSLSCVYFPIASWYDLSPNTQYRLVVKPNVSVTITRRNYLNNGGSPLTIPSNVRAATFPLGGNCYWTDASSGSFVDNQDAISVLGPLMVPGGSVTGGGLLRHPGYGGGVA